VLAILQWFSSQPEWLKGAVAGIVATLLGFLFSIFWDLYKYRRDRKEQDSSLISALKQELEFNSRTMNRNIKTIEKELELIKDNNLVVTPIYLIQTDVYDVIKISMPSKIAKKQDIYLKLQLLYYYIHNTNQIIRSTQFHRDQSESIQNIRNKSMQLLNVTHTTSKMLDELYGMIKNL
jgi:hypothetical protein